MNATKPLKQESSAGKDSICHLPSDISRIDDFYFLTPSGLCYGPNPDAPAIPWQPLLPAEAGRENWEGVVRSYKSRLNAANGLVLVPDAGDGGLMNALRRQGLAVMGCEPSVRLVQLARRKYGLDEHTFRCSEAEPFLEWLNRIGRKAQAVFLSRALEHVLNPGALWHQIANVLDEDGLVIAQVADDANEVGQGMANQSAVVRTAAQCGLKLENVDCNFVNSFTALVFKKTPIGQLDPACLLPPVRATVASRV